MVTNIQQAKSHALGATSHYLTEAESIQRLQDYRTYLQGADTEQCKEFWRSEVSSLEAWIESDAFKTGTHPQGIDDLIIALVEFRAYVYSFQNVDTAEDIFSKYLFFATWTSGSSYATLSIIGKLLGKDGRDNSLRNLWKDIGKFVLLDSVCTKAEVDFINVALVAHDGRLSSRISPALLARNKMVAHNESSPKVSWTEIDDDIELLLRIWALTVRFCSIGLFRPFANNDEAFAGIDRFFSVAEQQMLRTQRDKYLEGVHLVCRTDCATGLRDNTCGPFASISLTVNATA